MASRSKDRQDTEAELRRRIAELEARLAAADGVSRESDDADGEPPTTSVDTGGGAYVGNQVDAGGHFIGRDFIQIVNQVLRQDEDPAEAHSVIAHYLHALANDLAGVRLVLELATGDGELQLLPLLPLPGRRHQQQKARRKVILLFWQERRAKMVGQSTLPLVSSEN